MNVTSCNKGDKPTTGDLSLISHITTSKRKKLRLSQLPFATDSVTDMTTS